MFITQRIHQFWVCFTPEGVLQNGSIFKSQTHFDIGVAPWAIVPGKEGEEEGEGGDRDKLVHDLPVYFGVRGGI